MKKLKIDTIMVAISLAVVASFYVWNVLASTGIYDLSDGLQHYSIARYAPHHPLLYLDHWGKPFFTLVASFFAQFGVKAVMLMNVLLTLISGFFTFRILQKLQLKGAYVAPLFIAAGPAWFSTTMGPLTEVLFATIFVFAMYFLVEKKFWLAAFLAGILPFARSEAYFIVPLFFVALAWLKQYRALIWLIIPAFIYSVVGYFAFDDFLWIINKNPYVGAKDIYGSGQFWHFYEQMYRILGTAVGFVGTAGALLWIVTFYKKPVDEKKLVTGIAAIALLAVTIAHSYLWWKGLYGSLGLTRVLATVAPAYVILFTYFINKIALKAPEWVTHVLIIGLGIYTAHKLFSYAYIPKYPEEEEKMAIQLAEWKNNSPYKDVKNVWYIYPPVGLYCDIDQFDAYNAQPLYYLNRILPSNQIRSGGLIVYDGARAPNEGRTSKESLVYDRHLKLIKDIQPAYPIIDGHGYNFELLVFEKQPDLLNDTLAYEDFLKHRPIIEDRLGKVQRDSTGRKFLELSGMTQWFEVFYFWGEEKNWWQADSFTMDVMHDGDVSVVLYVNTDAEGTKDYYPQEKSFKMPVPLEDINWAQLGVFCPNTENPARVYSWSLIKKND